MMSDPAIFDYSPYSAGSSGYGSGEESPFPFNTDESYINRSLDFVHAIQHDHKYTIFDGDSPRQADLLINNYFKKEPPPVLYQSQIYANALPFDKFLENNFNAVEVAFEPNAFNLENPNSSSATLIQPINQFESPNINNFNNPVSKLANPNVYNCDNPSVSNLDIHNVYNPQYPNVFDYVEMKDLGNSPNELYADTNEDNQEFNGGESFNRDDGFFEALRELMDDLIPNEIDTINEVTQSCKVYELRIRHYLSGKTVLEFEPKLRDFCLLDIEAHDPSAYRLICDLETTQLMSSCIHEDMKLMENGHLSVTLKYKELVK